MRKMEEKSQAVHHRGNPERPGKRGLKTIGPSLSDSVALQHLNLLAIIVEARLGCFV
jgi:hypothetical protein